jgi:hypothetical protein
MVQSFPLFRVQLVNGITAGHLDVITSVPFTDGNEKNTEIAVGHKHLISAVASAQAADYCFGVIKYFLSLAHAAYKEHRFLLKLNAGFTCSHHNQPPVDGKIIAG